MSGLTLRSVVAMCVLVAFAFQLVFIPESVEAKYRDNSDQLPSDGSSTATTVLLIAAAGCLVVATVLMIKHHHNKSKQKETDAEQTPAADSTATAPESSLIDASSVFASGCSFESRNSVTSGCDRFISPYLSITPAKHSLSGEKMLVAGVVVGF